MRGFTLLEMTVSLGLLAGIIGTIAVGIAQDTTAHEVIVLAHGPEMKLRSTLDRIATDLRMAGVWGEDLNQDFAMSAEEDLNGNGVFDSDWSLADGANANELVFNRRQDSYDTDGALLATGVYSTKVAYRLVGTDIVRETSTYDPGGDETIQRAVLAHRVRGLQFARDGGVISVRIDVDIVGRGGTNTTRSLETQVWLRN